MGSSLVRLAHRRQYFLRIALQVTYCHIDLSKCHTKRYDIHKTIPFPDVEEVKGVSLMEMQVYVLHVVPFIVIVYLSFLLFMRPPREVVLPTLLGGLTMGVINPLVDSTPSYPPLCPPLYLYLIFILL